MRINRITLPLAAGELELPSEGPVAVLGAREPADYGPIATDRLHFAVPQRGLHDRLRAAGLHVAEAPEALAPHGPFAAALVHLPRARAEAEGLIGQAIGLVGPGAPVILEGAKAEGVEGILRRLRQAGLTLGEVHSKAHGKAVVLWADEAAASLAARWRAAAAPRQREGWWTAPGLFSADGPDPASELLAAELAGRLSGRVVDLGAGWGFLAARVLAADAEGRIERLDLVEHDRRALALAERNLTDSRAAFHWQDVRAIEPEGRGWDAAITNPPFHAAGRRAAPELAEGFIEAAARVLRPGGELWLVANRHLPYERPMRARFREVAIAREAAGFKILHGRGPLAAPGRRRSARRAAQAEGRR
ncbi:MAG: class I SAM-dependent methyltransferase [Alphaproteobacteria bacterium]|nr:MAG: class I SAM-dependent methyltransferase [Alphaproteobacteria bacterium]